MPDFHYCETVHVFDDEGAFVRGNIDGHPPPDEAAPVPVLIHDGTPTGRRVLRSRDEIYDFSLARWMQGKRGAN